MRNRLLAGVVTVALVAGCSAGRDSAAWVDEEVTFTAGGLTLYGTYHHRGTAKSPAALLISESGQTDRNGDNNIAGAVGNMRQLADYLASRGVATLRYDKVGTGKTGLGPHADDPAAVGSAVYTDGARAAARFLADQPATGRLSVYALGEGATHAMTLAADRGDDVPKIHSLALLQPLPARYLDLITSRVRADLSAAVATRAKTQRQADQVLGAWTAAVVSARTEGTAPARLPEGLSAILNPGNVKAVAEADSIDPLRLARGVPAGTPVLLSCSDSDGQADCADMTPLRDALADTALEFVALRGVNHVLRDDAGDDVGNYARQDPLSPQLTAALDVFLSR